MRYNDKMTKIICAACKKEIKTREELAVVGRSFVPYHRKCFEKSRGVYEFYSGYPINSVATWVIWGLLNTALWATYFIFEASFSETFVMSLFLTALFVVFRLIVYFGYEIKLPKKL